MAELTEISIPSMDWNAKDAPQLFQKFKAKCQLILDGPLKKKTKEEKVNYLQLWSGDDGIELVSTWNLDEDEKKELDTYWTRFEQFVAPKSNFRLNRFKLRSIKQGPDEAVDAFTKRLRICIQECKFTSPDEQLIDALIFGVSSDSTRTKLLKESSDLNINKALDIARITEKAAKQQVKYLNSVSPHHDSSQVHTLQHKIVNKPNCKEYKNPTNSYQKSCLNHDFSSRQNCPAFGKRCYSCGKDNHWSLVCHSSQTQPRAQQTMKPTQNPKKPAYRQQHSTRPVQMHTIQQQEFDDNNEQLYFHTLDMECNITNKQNNNTQALVTIEINSKSVLCKIYTGAEGNVIPMDKYRGLIHTNDNTKLTPSNTKIIAFGGHIIKQYGNCMLTVSHQNTSVRCLFHVVQSQGPIILGLPTCRDLKLITLNYSIDTRPTVSQSMPASQLSDRPKGNPQAKAELLNNYEDCFTGIGCFEGEYHITLDPTVPPVIHPPHRVPEALREPLKKELDSLCQQQILQKVEKPTDWVNSIVCVTKPNGTIRLCLDPKDLNKAVKRPRHCTPTLNDILPKLNGAKYFSIVDARSGYWNIKLDEESSYYTTFNTPHGRYRFLRLPFGLVCAQDIFQKKIDETFGDLTGVTGIADDTIIAGFKEDGTDHDTNLLAVMERARASGVRFNADKCCIKCTRIPFFGHILSANGLEPDPAKVEAITNLDPSTSLQDLQTFLGATQFLSKFIPNLTSITAPLWDLTKKTSVFNWSPEHQTAVDSVKNAVVLATTLKYFDSSKPVTVQVDASQRVLGAVLLQDQGPVAFGSKLLTDTESRYSNIEREMLAVVYGLEKFHYYVYGRPVTVETEPLEAISKKHLASAPPRISRMLLRIQRYNAHIVYIPGKEVPLADALSRISPCQGGEIQGLDVSVHELSLHLNASATRISQIKEETNKDPELSALRKLVADGWPRNRQECPPSLHTYWNYRDELTVTDGLILKGLRIIIPKTLQAEVLSQLHYAHQGTEKCKLRAKGSVFWPNINQDVEQMVKRCSPCQRHQNENTKDLLICHDVPQKPWHTLASDLFFWNNLHYLLVADYYSKFPLVRKLTSTTSQAIIAHLKSIFEEQGIPEKLITDNGPNYASEVFKKFSTTWGFQHVTSSPMFPQSNGFIERTVQTVKNILQKCKEAGTDPHLAMLCLRTTPVDHQITSPSEMLNSRVYNSNLPTVSKASLGLSANGEINERLQQRQDKQKSSHDKSTKELQQLYPNDPVRILNQQTHQWEPAIIQEVSKEPRSYMVTTQNGRTLTRNRRHLHQTSEQITIQMKPEEEELTPDVSAIHHGVNQPGTEKEAMPQMLRRSSREIKPPQRLDL